MVLSALFFILILYIVYIGYFITPRQVPPNKVTTTKEENKSQIVKPTSTKQTTEPAQSGSSTPSLATLDREEQIRKLIIKSNYSYRDTRWAAEKELAKFNDKEVLLVALKLIQDSEASSREAAVHILGELNAREAIPEIAQLLQDEDNNVRREVITVLSNLYAIKTIPELIKVLQDTDKEVRKLSAQALGHLGAREAIPELIKLLNDEEDEVTESALVALIALRAKQAIPELIRLIKEGTWKKVVRASDGLVHLDAEEAIPELIQLLETSDESTSRLYIVETLRQLKATATAPELRRLLPGMDWETRAAIARTLTEFADKESIPDLIGLLQDPQREVRQAAADALKDMQVKEAIPELIKLLNDENEYVIRSACEALAKLRAREAVPELVKLLSHSNKFIRNYSAQALTELDAKEILPELTKLSSNTTDVYERLWMITNRIKLGDQGATPELIMLLQDEKVGFSAVRLMGDLGIREAIPSLMTLFKQQSGFHSSIAEVLIKLNAKESVPEFINLLLAATPDDWQRRISIDHALCKLISPETFPEIIKLLKHPDKSVRYSAVHITSACNIDIKDKIPALASALDNNDDIFRRVVAEQLGQYNSPGITSIMLKLLNDPCWEIRVLASETLAGLGIKEAIPSLINMLNSAELNEQLSAASSLGKFGAQEAIPQLIKLLNTARSPLRGVILVALMELGAKDLTLSIVSKDDIIEEIEYMVSRCNDRDKGSEFKSRARAALKKLGVSDK